MPSRSANARLAEIKSKFKQEDKIFEDNPRHYIGDAACDPVTYGGSVKDAVKQAKKRGMKKKAPIATHKLLTLHLDSSKD